MAQFASTADLGDYLGETLTGTRLGQAIIHLELASALIQNKTRQRLERVVDDVLVLAGTADWELELPERPVISVASVKVDGVLLAATGYRLADSMLIRRTSGWTGPVDSLIEVTYTHGYDPIPDDIRAATLALAARMTSNPLGVRQEGIGSYSVSYGDPSGGGGADDVLGPIIKKYRRQTATVPLHRPDRIVYPVANQ